MAKYLNPTITSKYLHSGLRWNVKRWTIIQALLYRVQTVFVSIIKIFVVGLVLILKWKYEG